MKIQYLGTAAAEGWPGIFCNCDICKKASTIKGKNIRTRSQALIDDKILIDFPPDTYAHMLQYDLKIPSIKTLIVTHSHQDHWYPEDLMFRGEGFAGNIDGILDRYGNDKIYERLKETQKFVGEVMTERAQIKYHQIQEFCIYAVQGYEIIPLKALHNRSENCYIYIIKNGDKTLLYANDTGYFPEETWEFIKDFQFDLVSMDCTMQKYKEGTNHMGIEDNVEVVERLKNMGCVTKNTKYVITHFSHNGGMLHEDIEKEVEKYGFCAAYDGYSIEF